MTAIAPILDYPIPSREPLPVALARRVSPATVIRRDEPLAKRTTLRVGGPAEVYVEPASEADLAEVVKVVAERGVNLFVLGRGSNLLVRDGGIRGVVLCLAHPAFGGVEILGERMRCGAGAKLKQVANEARRAGLSGIEFLEGIPGTVGGALRMNAGAMGSWTFAAVEFVRFMDYAAGGSGVDGIPGLSDVEKPHRARGSVPVPPDAAGGSRRTHEDVQCAAVGLAADGPERGLLFQEYGDDSRGPVDSGVGPQRLSRWRGDGFLGAWEFHRQ